MTYYYFWKDGDVDVVEADTADAAYKKVLGKDMHDLLDLAFYSDRDIRNKFEYDKEKNVWMIKRK